jgi:hypothetical protein
MTLLQTQCFYVITSQIMEFLHKSFTFLNEEIYLRERYIAQIEQFTATKNITILWPNIIDFLSSPTL